MQFIEGWVKWNWCEFLQIRNPSIPAVPREILPVLQRLSMSKEIEYWSKIVEHEEVKCIYTNKVLNSFDLDHFLPWTFVTHNQLWNLIPADSAANSSKSNILPDLSYFDRFVETQASAIKTSKGIFSDAKWEKYMQPYISDLNIARIDDVLEESKLERAYRNTLLPLHEIAKINRFKHSWIYRVNEVAATKD